MNAIRPGMTLTDMTDALRRDPELRARVAATIAMGRCAEPEEVARPILWLLSDEASFVSGAILEASGGGFMLAPGGSSSSSSGDAGSGCARGDQSETTLRRRADP